MGFAAFAIRRTFAATGTVLKTILRKRRASVGCSRLVVPGAAGACRRSRVAQRRGAGAIGAGRRRALHAQAV
jgi:hypothetical protein